MKCQICPHNCDITYEEKTICEQNPVYDSENNIYTVKTEVNPIEKNKLYHYLPGSKTLSIGVLGCNLKCNYCLNHKIAQPENQLLIPTRKYTPEQLVQQAADNNTQSITWKYTEPTIHPKWIIQTAKTAKKHDIKTVLKTNGYTSQKTLENIKNYVDAVNVEIKSMEDKFYRQTCHGELKPVLESIRFYLENEIHVEIENTIIPGYTDNPGNITEIINFIKKNSDTIPLHFHTYNPAFNLKDTRTTNKKTLIKSCDRARYNKLKYVYPDINIAPYKNNTYCKNCKHLLIKRSTDYIIENHITKQGACPKCNHKADVIIIKK